MLASAFLVKWMEVMMWFIIIEKRYCQHGRVLQRRERFWSNKFDDNNKSDKNNSLLLSPYNVLVTILGSSYIWNYLILITNLLVKYYYSPFFWVPEGLINLPKVM